MISPTIFFERKDFQDLDPVDFGWQECEPGYCYGPAVRTYYLIHYVKKGCGVLETANGTFTVTAGQIFLIKPEEITTYTADSQDPWQYVWLGFRGSQAERLDKLEPVINFPDKLFLELNEEARDRVVTAEWLAAKAFLLMDILFPATEKTPYTAQLAAYIRHNYRADLQVEKMALSVNVNRRHLTRMFKKAYGMTVQQYIIHTRMKNAVRFLERGYSVSKTAELVGYDDMFQFSKMFKKTYGVSPKQYEKGL